MKSAIFSKNSLACLVLAMAPVFVQAALTDLATKPISGGTQVSFPPNLMFILDESQSMLGDYSPDWADGYNNSNQQQGFTADEYGQKKNSSFNGIAYNPATTYTPPVYFTNAGAVDTTTYRSQTRANTTNWTKVFVDPFTDSTKTRDLTQDNLFYFTTIPGEFCTSKAMLSCQKDKAGLYTVAAPLRWCNSPDNATKDSPALGTCQAVEIDNLGNIAKFAYPRMPWPNLSVLIMPAGGGSISNITVNGLSILSAATGAQISDVALAAALQDKINLCSFELSGACAVSGYRAIAYRTQQGDTRVNIYAPEQFSADVTPNVNSSPVIVPTKFASMNTNYVKHGGAEMANKVAGVNLPTIIFEQVQKYPKDPDRTDCIANVGHCTYDEEMTNYANWYAYYRTRMQMMKTATSQAFSSLTDGFRVGFMSVNNQTGTSSMGDLFLNIETFNSAQKHAWYRKLFSTKANGSTPLRMALAQAGRIYAGKLKGTFGSSNTQINDPVLNSCQINVSILSTDGYWTAGDYFSTGVDKDYGVMLDGITEVGHQDSLPGVVRPQLDAGQPTFTIKSTQKMQSIRPTYRPQARVTTTTAKHFQLQTRLQDITQIKESTLQKKTWALTQTVWPLQKKTAQLQTQQKNLMTRSWGPLVFSHRYDVDVYQVAQKATPYTVTKTTKNLRKVVTPLKKVTYSVKQTDSKLYVKPVNLTQTNYKLQIAHSQQAQESRNGGVTWTNVATCEDYKYPLENLICRYSPAPATAFADVPDGGTCTPVTIPAGEQGLAITVDVGRDNQRTRYTTQTSCQYVVSGTSSPDTCTPTTLNAPTANTANTEYISKQTMCTYVAGTETLATAACTPGTASVGETWKKYETCRYVDQAVQTLPVGGTCTIKQKSTGSSLSVLTATACSYNTSGVTATGEDSLSSCTSVPKQTGTGNTVVYAAYVDCTYNTAKNVTSNYPATADLSCTPKGKGSAPNYTEQVTCSYVSTSAAGVAPSTCAASTTSATSPCSESNYSCQQTVTCSAPVAGTTVTTYPATCTKSTTVDMVVDCVSTKIRTDLNQASCPANSGQYTYVCRMLPGTATCDPSVANDCVWGWGIWQPAATCKRTVDNPNAMPAGYKGSATDCAYEASFTCTDNSGANCWSNATSACVPNTDGTIAKDKEMKPLVNCKYLDYGPATGTASCTSDAQLAAGDIGSTTLGSTGYPLPQRTLCGYWSANAPESPVSNCKQASASLTSTTAAAGKTYSGDAVACSYTVGTDWTDAVSCTPQPRPSISVTSTANFTQGTATACQYVVKPWRNPAAGETCVPSAPACTGLPDPDKFCDTGASCTSSATCSVGKVTECGLVGWSAWADVTDAAGCTPQAGSGLTPARECQYVEIGTRYYVGDADFTNCANINNPRPANFTGATPEPLVAVEECKKTFVLPPAQDAWLDIPVDTKNGQKVSVGTVGTLNGGSHTFLAQYLPDYTVSGTTPNSPGIKTAAGYNVEYNAGDASTLPFSVNPAGCTAADETDDDGTYLHNKVACYAVDLPDETGKTSCPKAEDRLPTAANQWKTVTSCVEVPGAPTKNTLSDVAQYYYMTDLRAPGFENCTGPLGNDVCENNIVGSKEDPATWQHMQTYTLGLGASGYMQYNDKYTSGGSEDFNAIADAKPSNLATGLCSWQTDNTTCNWPKPAPTSQTNIDDLWHAAVNGRGVYYSATNPTSLALGLGDALQKIGQKQGSSSSVTLSPESQKDGVTGGKNAYYATYTDGAWTGELTARTVNSDGSVDMDHCLFDDDSNSATPPIKVSCVYNAEGVLLPGLTEVLIPPVWAAQGQLDLMLNASEGAYANRIVFTRDNTPENLYTGRRPFMWDNLADTEKVFFSEAKIGTMSQMCLDADVSCLSEAKRKEAAGENLVNFIRGDSSKEDGVNIGLYRKRDHFLGDIVNASPAYVKAPTFLYSDKGYWKHKLDHAERIPMVYAAANDGMLHAFYAETNAEKGTVGGKEAWAYIPTTVMPNLFRLADKNYKEKHQFYVDGTPTIGDICIDNCPSAQEQPPAVWRTILVGGLNHGGAGYYALDITDPQILNPDDSTKGPRVLWEFSNKDDEDMGYTFGNPLITKLSDGTWVVMFTSGYNNVLPSEGGSGTGGDGKGYLYILEAKSGNLIRKISTEVGSTAVPSGLSRIDAWVEYPQYENTAERVYGGDLLGNLWRFDINLCHKDNPESECHYYAQLLAVLKNEKGELQPITAKPELSKVDGRPFVFMGTGQLLGPTDMLTASRQSFYGIYDPVTGTTADNALTPIYDNPRDTVKNNFLKQEFKNSLCSDADIINGLCKKVAEEMLLSTHILSFAQGHRGWYVDFTVNAERVDTDPRLVDGTLVINTNVPTEASACAPSGYNNRYYLDYKTGGGIGEAVGGFASAGGYRMQGFVGNVTISETTGGSGGRLGLGLVDGKIDESEIPIKQDAVQPRHVSWRQLLTDN